MLDLKLQSQAFGNIIATLVAGQNFNAAVFDHHS